MFSNLYNTAFKIYVRIIFILNGIINFRSSHSNYQKLNNKTIIVYSMGKVASSSIYYSFMKFFPFSKVFHNHFLSEHWMKKLKNTVYSRNIKLGNRTISFIKNNPKNINYYIVLMRDPISRDLSNIIQNYVKKDIDINNISLKKLFNIIENEGHDFFDKWFETEFNNYFKINILDINFDKSKGYSIVDLNKKNKLIILQLEQLSKNFVTSMNEFLEIDFEYLYNFNLSSNKLESELYKGLKNQYKLSESTLNKIYSSEYIRNFYNDDQIKRFINNWKIEKN